MTRFQASLLVLVIATRILPVRGDEPNPAMERATKLLGEGKHDEALAELARAKQLDPNLPPARLQLYRLMAKNRNDQARAGATLELAIAENPFHSLCYLDNASRALADGRLTEAVLNNERALSLSAAKNWSDEQKKLVSAQVRSNLAAAEAERRKLVKEAVQPKIPRTEKPTQVWERGERDNPAVEKNPAVEEAASRLINGEVGESLFVLAEEVKRNPALVPARLMLARLMNRISQYDRQWRGQLEVVIVETPDHPVGYLDNGHFALTQGRYTDAILNSERALQLATTGKNWTPKQKRDVTVYAHTNMAAAYESRQDWEGVRVQFQALVAADSVPYDPTYHAGLARALFHLGRLGEAHAEFAQAYRLDATGKSDAPSVALAELWEKKGGLVQAHEEYKKAIGADGKDARLRVAYADFLLQQNDIDSARVQIDAAVKLKPDDVDVRKHQGLMERIKKDYATAEQIFRQVIVDSPQDVDARNHLAISLIEQTNVEKHRRALEMASRNANVHPTNASAYATLGYLYYCTGDLDAAINSLEKSAELANGQLGTDANYYKALCLAKAGRRDDAREAVRAAIAAKGLFVYRKEALELLDELGR
jgi:tetratricopeptide (TPR) repeat protein